MRHASPTTVCSWVPPTSCADALEYYRTEVHRLIFDGCANSDSPQDGIDRFYIRNFLRRWFGNENELDTQHRVFPLYSTTVVELAFGIGAKNRHAEWIHYQLMRECCPQLTELPFASGTWAAGASRPLAPAEHRHEVPPSGPPPRRPLPARASSARPRTVMTDWRANLQTLDLDLMRRFLSDESNPLFEIADPAATKRAVQSFPNSRSTSNCRSTAR